MVKAALKLKHKLKQQHKPQPIPNKEQSKPNAKLSNIKSMVAVHDAIQKSATPEKATATVFDEVIKDINELLQKD
jgi:hypothetical protein